MIIYIRVGIEIFQKRNQLAAISSVHDETLTSMTSPSHGGEFSFPNPPPFTGLKTMEVEVSTSSWDGDSEDNPQSPTSPPRIYSPREQLAHRPPPATPSPNANTNSKTNYFVSISSPSSHTPFSPGPGNNTSTSFPRRKFSISSSMDRVKWAYTKCALLFLIAVLITWVPSSANRVWGLIHPSEPSYTLNICAALVLPLQGFWNTVIYFSTSLEVCRRTVRDWKEGREDAQDGGIGILQGGFRLGDFGAGGGTGGLDRRVNGGGKKQKSESLVELSTSRSVEAESF